MVIIATLKKLVLIACLAAGVGGGIYYAGRVHSEEERFNRDDGSYIMRYYDAQNRRHVVEYDTAGVEVDHYIE